MKAIRIDNKVKTPINVTTGTWAGQKIRRARVGGQCDYWKGQEGRCTNYIKPGELYMSGELNEDAGGFGQDRYCLMCAGDDAYRAIVKATEEQQP